VCDYIAGMTDQYPLRLHQELIGTPESRGEAAAAPKIRTR